MMAADIWHKDVEKIVPDSVQPGATSRKIALVG